MLKMILLFDLFLLFPGLITAQEAEPVSVNEFAMAESLTKQVQPVYPPLARSIRVQGTVVLTVHIGKDGTVLDTSLFNGHPLLYSCCNRDVPGFRFPQ
jgi:hypothetical protein